MKIKAAYIISGILFGLVGAALLGFISFLFLYGFTFGAWLGKATILGWTIFVLFLSLFLYIFYQKGKQAEIRALADYPGEIKKSRRYVTAAILIVLGVIAFVFWQIQKPSFTSDPKCIDALLNVESQCKNNCGGNFSDPAVLQCNKVCNDAYLRDLDTCRLEVK
jgi:hypothetical protein